MPELPEVENTVRDLKKKVLQKIFVAVWADGEKVVRRPKDFLSFKEGILGKKILAIERKGKNIIFYLSDKKILLIHQKLTGHLLWGRWEKRGKEWLALENKALSEDPMNRFLRLVFTLNDGSMLALSDLRRFAKVELWEKEAFEKESDIKKLGPEPLSKELTFKKFKELISQRKKKIKQVLMDQEVIAGIGNIYSDEILFEAKVHPLKEANQLTEAELKRIFEAMKKILPQAVKLGGTSVSDYRKPDGTKGRFGEYLKVYQREGEPCYNCQTPIERLKIGGRSAHFCSKCQK